MEDDRSSDIDFIEEVIQPTNRRRNIGSSRTAPSKKTAIKSHPMSNNPPILFENIWANNTPPRGPCLHKTSLLNPACACLRFMLHPLKAATFLCDGCGHHASFHKMESSEPDNRSLTFVFGGNEPPGVQREEYRDGKAEKKRKRIAG